MLGKDLREIIARVVGRENCSDLPEELLLHSYDAMNRRYLPEMVVHPGSTEEVAALLSLANQHRFPVIPRGAGTGFSGGSLPVSGGVVATTRRLDRVLAIDEGNMTALVEAGVINGDLQALLIPKGLFYPPDPSSLRFSTLGGNAAENAGGPRAVKYGVTRDYVLGLTAVLPTGEVVRTGSAAMKSVTGYDLTRLLVGSEGTLAFITSLLLRLLPLPEATRTALATFPDMGLAAGGVAAIMSGRIIPSALEFMDRTAIRVVEEHLHAGLPLDAAALLLIEVDGPALLVEDQIVRLEALCLAAGATAFTRARTSEESGRLWKARRSISPALMKVRPDKINEDVAVPRMRIPDLVRGVEKIASDYGLTIANFGHAGDGNVHVNILYDAGDESEKKRANAAVDDLFRLTLSLGGTLSGEHGIGIAKAPWLGLECTPESIALMRRIKRAFDPNDVLNPGKTFDFPPREGG
jgi:glycolate oxidase